MAASYEWASCSQKHSPDQPRVSNTASICYKASFPWWKKHKIFVNADGWSANTINRVMWVCGAGNRAGSIQENPPLSPGLEIFKLPCPQLLPNLLSLPPFWVFPGWISWDVCIWPVICSPKALHHVLPGQFPINSFLLMLGENSSWHQKAQ